jgi:hypothetical protein
LRKPGPDQVAAGALRKVLDVAEGQAVVEDRQLDHYLTTAVERLRGPEPAHTLRMVLAAMRGELLK